MMYTHPRARENNAKNKNRILVVFALLGGLSFTVTSDAVDMIYHNGSILTMAGDQPAYVESLPVKVVQTIDGFHVHGNQLSLRRNDGVVATVRTGE